MRLYISFFIRCWLLRDTPRVKDSVIDIERVEPEIQMRVGEVAEPGNRMFKGRRLKQLPPAAVRGFRARVERYR